MVWLGIKSIHQNPTSMKEDITNLVRATALEESHKAHDDDIADLQNSSETK